MRIVALVLLLVLTLAAPVVSEDGDGAARVPVIYCSDLFHPHDDPDDHFDIASIYALEEVKIRGIVLDQGDRQEKQPGRIPIEQLNHLTGRSVPWATGLSAPLESPGVSSGNNPGRAGDGVGHHQQASSVSNGVLPSDRQQVRNPVSSRGDRRR